MSWHSIDGAALTLSKLFVLWCGHPFVIIQAGGPPSPKSIQA